MRRKELARYTKPLESPSLKAHSKKTPAWRQAAKRILTLKGSGFSEAQISKLTDANIDFVRKVVSDDEIADEISVEIYEKKIPTMQEIINLSLHSINQTIKEMAADESLRKVMLGSMKDVALLTKVVSDLNTLVRLELGQSTQNVEVHQHTHTYQETREAIQELKKIDPVFDYPELPPPKEDEKVEG